MEPGVQYMCMEGASLIAQEDCTPNGHIWNVLITAHGILMMFFVLIPALFGGFGNYFMPLQIGAPDMAFPRLNNLSYWLFVAGSALAVASVLSPGGNGQLGSGVGWVLYPPLSTNEAGYSMDLAIFAVHVSGASSILGAINIITTFLNMRAPGMTLFKVPLFAWSIFITAWMILLALPVLAGAITMLLTDRNFGTAFFRPVGRRRPGAVSTHLVVLRSSGSVYHHPARLRYYQPCDRNLLAQAGLWLHADGLGHDRHRCSGLHRLGAPHVYGRHVADPADLFHAGHDDDRGAHGDQDLLLDRDHVERLCQL